MGVVTDVAYDEEDADTSSVVFASNFDLVQVDPVIGLERVSFITA